MTLDDLLNRHSSSNGQGYNLLKENMRFFIEGVNSNIWKVVMNGPFVPTREVIGVVVNKEEDDWTKDENKKMQCSVKAKIIIIIALGLDELLCVFYCDT